MLKSDTLKNGTSRIGLYGSAPPSGWYCTNQIFLKNFTECSNVIDFVSVTNLKIGTYITPRNISRLPENSFKLMRIQIQPPANPLFQFFEIRNADLICLSCNCDFSYRIHTKT